MVFSYYNRLSRGDRAIYDRSDAIDRVPLPDPGACSKAMLAVRDALSEEDRSRTQKASGALARTICEQLEAPPPVVKVLAKRPSDDWGELHGLYEPRDDYTPRGIVTVWMRTAQRKQVVAPRSFLRTVLHELCHHLDYEHFGLDDSFHTEGFYKRESSLFKQLAKNVDIPSAASSDQPATPPKPKLSDAERMRRKRVETSGEFPGELKKILNRRG